MKTVVDAVNALRGEMSGAREAFLADRVKGFVRNYHFVVDGTLSGEDSYEATFPDGALLNFSVKEFNQCVAEMAEGLFVPLSDLNKRKASGECEMLTDKDGNQYQKGDIYDFSLDGDEWSFGYIDNIDVKSMYEFSDSYGVNWRMCRVPLGELGTITKAPLVLEDGDICKYDVINGSGVTVETSNLGYYDKSANAMHFGEIERSVVWCTNIIKLVPESK